MPKTELLFFPRKYILPQSSILVVGMPSLYWLMRIPTVMLDFSLFLSFFIHQQISLTLPENICRI